jgi:hypothetical protein
MTTKKQAARTAYEIQQAAQLELIQKEWYMRVVKAIASSISADAFITGLINNHENVPQACQIITTSGDKYPLLFDMPSTILNSSELDAIEAVEGWLESAKIRLEQEIRLNEIKKQAIAKLSEEERKALGL